MNNKIKRREIRDPHVSLKLKTPYKIKPTDIIYYHLCLRVGDYDQNWMRSMINKSIKDKVWGMNKSKNSSQICNIISKKPPNVELCLWALPNKRSFLKIKKKQKLVMCMIINKLSERVLGPLINLSTTNGENGWTKNANKISHTHVNLSNNFEYEFEFKHLININIPYETNISFPITNFHNSNYILTRFKNIIDNYFHI